MDVEPPRRMNLLERLSWEGLHGEDNSRGGGPHQHEDVVPRPVLKCGGIRRFRSRENQTYSPTGPRVSRRKSTIVHRAKLPLTSGEAHEHFYHTIYGIFPCKMTPTCEQNTENVTGTEMVASRSSSRSESVSLLAEENSFPDTVVHLSFICESVSLRPGLPSS